MLHRIDNKLVGFLPFDIGETSIIIPPCANESIYDPAFSFLRLDKLAHLKLVEYAIKMKSEHNS